MCGICGVAFKEHNPSTNTKNIIQEMLAVINHRGPDDTGIEVFKNVALGHKRLSILDLSQAGHQPMKYEERLYITYNGEIYNYLELRTYLIKYGYVFKSHSDTEVILVSYQHWGEDCVKYFNGMWAFCIYDNVNKTLFCSRDRFGVKPFYYSIKENKLYFSSEIKQILTQSEIPTVANKTKLIEFLFNGLLDTDETTLFENIFQLKPGHNLSLNVDSWKHRIYKWYDLSVIKPINISYNNAVNLYRNTFFNSVNIRLRSDVKVGSCLSGGIDSSSIVCTMDKILNDNFRGIQHTVSSCFVDKSYDEQEYIDEVTQNTGTINHKIYPNMDNLLNDIDLLVWHMDEPFATTSVYAQWNIFKKAKELDLKVMLDGQGADEQLAGYNQFYNVLFNELFTQFRIIKLLRELKFFFKYNNIFRITSKVGYILRILSNSLPTNVTSKINRSLSYDNYYQFPVKSELFNSYVDVKYAKKASNSRNSKKYILNQLDGHLQTLLHYEDRNSMAHSIESRVPFLDYNLVEYTYSLPITYKIRNGIRKSILRDGMADVIPDKIYNRKSKLGFVTPENEWMQNNSIEIEKEYKNAVNKISSIINVEESIFWFNDNFMKKAKANQIVWRIICIGRWIDVFKVSV